ncbi:TetR/AcrR family transcriptional regulator [Kibdelosporangium aridum]|uniref:TetR/AcrR family transcriptional regulator n=1 Tax=Kibdelosporangium aridum TaxID=2030 RepID=A0A428ZMX6_KIBAR|nr:TetR family transcriptional regulator [Kibdelosporangium aridum]RSM89396.1 TetR/AcrR family transcriptional regulator [Kibdelosporangium aridum]
MAQEFQRARRPEQKQQRYDAILSAARALAERDSVRDTSLADIAAEVGMHKSALLKYFTTRDEIYLKLAAEDYMSLAVEIREALAKAESIGDVAAVFSRTLAARPLLCDLIAHVPLNLERTVPLEAVREYKLAIMPGLYELAEDIRGVLPSMTDEALLDLITMVTAVAASLHQLGNPPETLARLYREMPELGHTWMDFEPTLRRIIETFLRGQQAR